MAAGTRDRMLDSTVTLMQQRGANAVTVDAVLAHSGAPRGSVYHHFPGGRDEMILAAVTRAGDNISAMLSRSVADGDAADAVTAFIGFWKTTMRESDYTAGCPVMALAVDRRSDIPAAGETVRIIFTRWLKALERETGRRRPNPCAGPTPGDRHRRGDRGSLDPLPHHKQRPTP